MTGCGLNSKLQPNRSAISSRGNKYTSNQVILTQSTVDLNVAESEKQFPDDIGWIDIKRDYGAAGDGQTDDTVAIQRAIEAPHSDYNRPKIIYFPEGTYLVSDTLQWPSDGQKCCVTFQGQGRNSTVIKLVDNSPLFGDANNPKAVIRTREGNIAFRHYIRELAVHTGNNNPGAIGIDYISNNRGAITNVSIKSGDGYGKIGLAMTREWPGPSLIKNVSIEGFDYGIRTHRSVYGLTFEHITLKNQNIAGILNRANTLAIRGLDSDNSVPVIQNRRSGLVILLDGNFQGGSSTLSAIENSAYLYARNIKANGYQSAIKDRQTTLPGLSHSEYISHQVYSLFDSPQKSLHLPVEETPSFHNNDLDTWANVENYPSIQAAMDSGKSTIYFPSGKHRISGIINIPATVRKIVGFESKISSGKEQKAVFKILEDSEHPLIIEGLLLGITVDHLSPRSLAIKHSKARGQVIRNGRDAGKLFLEDVQTHLSLEYPQDIWARQLNSETLRNPDTKVLNNGGNLWILGIKTEGKGTVIETTDGGRTELLGTLIYPVRKFNAEERNQAAFINNESSHSLIYSVSARGSNRNYRIQVKEVRDGETKVYLSQSMPNRVMPLFVGYQDK